MKPDRQLPDDLARLGSYLEVAAGETLRRRQRRQAMTNFVGAVMLAVPFALAVAAADLAPGGRPVPQPAGATLVRHPDPRHRLHGSPCPATDQGTLLRCSNLPAPLQPTLKPAPAGKR